MLEAESGKLISADYADFHRFKEEKRSSGRERPERRPSALNRHFFLLLSFALSLKICANLRNLWIISARLGMFAFWRSNRIFTTSQSPVVR